ncbi:MAG: FHA domain-containing protein [Enterobacteriaceae bacterium]|jgi:FHA domain-containing protein|nr:FHA domain-containing protein [Enterobacteriaceae bacterium]
MRFTIVKNTGINQPAHLSHDFSPPGGTLGRSQDNDWVLPDEEQKIARLQAIISISVEGECRITNRGSATEILLNTIPLAPNRQVELRSGDVLNIGSYQIQATDSEKPIYRRENDSDENSPIQATTSSDVPSGIPNSVWDELEHVFTPAAPHSAENRSTDRKPQAIAERNDNNPLLKDQQQENEERNPIDPLAKIKTTTDLDSLQQRATDPVTLFNSDSLFQQKNILHNNTPTTLFQHEMPHDVDHSEKKDCIDPLALFSDRSLSDRSGNSRQRTKSDDPLDLMLDNAVPLTLPENPDIVDIDSIIAPQPDVERVNVDHHVESAAQSPAIPPLFTSTADPQQVTATADPQQVTAEPQQVDTQAAKMEEVKTEGPKAEKPKAEEPKAEKAEAAETKTAEPMPITNDLFDSNKVQAERKQSTRDILIELKAHHLGMIAGGRAMVAEILHRFHPDVLEQTARKCGISRLSASSTESASPTETDHAALWEFLTNYYQKTAIEFERSSILFSETFLRAYENEVNTYQESQSKTK